MIIAIGVMFVTGLLLVAAFTVANGDVHSSHRSTLEKQAYYAALAGVQQYESLLQGEPNYWQNCKSLENKSPPRQPRPTRSSRSRRPVSQAAAPNRRTRR